MRTTSHRKERGRARDLDTLLAEWPPVAGEIADEQYLAPRRRGVRWDGPEHESEIPPGEISGERGRRGSMRWIAVIAFIIVAALLAGTLAIAQQGAKPARGEAAAGKSDGGEHGAVAEILDRKVVGDWVYGCVGQERPGVKLCFIRQQLADKETKAPVFTWTVGQDAAGNLIAVWQTPTGVMIGQGVVLDIGAEQAIPVPYQACTPGHCQAVANLAPAFLDRLAKADRVRATIVAATGDGLAFDFSVQGLAEGLAALK